MKRYPPVYSRVRPAALVRALLSATTGTVSGAKGAFNGALRSLGQLYPGTSIDLLDSGTSALLLALQRSALPRESRIVALPAFACPDLLAAAIAGANSVRLYDLDPMSLEPDLESLESALRSGANIVVVAHLFGRIANIEAAASLGDRYGATVVEDAAQHAGGLRDGKRGGTIARLSILSFGRGKGLNAGGGGALLTNEPLRSDTVDTQRVPTGMVDLLKCAATEYLSHPRPFALAALIERLEIGATNYKEAHLPAPMSLSTAMLLQDTIKNESSELATRRRNETFFLNRIQPSKYCVPIPVQDGVQSGALRTPVLFNGDPNSELMKLGVARSYPRLLMEYRESVGFAIPPKGGLPGSRLLVSRLWTLPTHRLLSNRERDRVVELIRGSGR